MNSTQKQGNSVAISVIIPLYNKEKYISRCLNSVFSQTYKNFEVIVVDDGSTDGGPDIVRRYNDPRLRLIKQENAGPGAARNRGIRESKAALLAFIDADDEWLPEFLEVCHDLLERHPDCMAVVTTFFYGSERVSWEEQWRKRGITEGPWQLQPGSSLKDMCLNVSFLKHYTSVSRREAVQKLGGFYDKDKCIRGEDTYLCLQMALNYRIYRYPHPLMWYHSEASELYIGLKGLPQLSPVHTNSDSVRKNCPQKHRLLLEQYLAFTALRNALRYARGGDYVSAKWLMRMFPSARRFNAAFIKTRLMISIAPLIRLLEKSPILCRCARRIKNLIRTLI